MVRLAGGSELIPGRGIRPGVFRVMSCARYVAALAVLVPVFALLWTLGRVIQLLGALSRLVARWGAGRARLEGAE